MIKPKQIKAGRAILGWLQKDLAHKSGYALSTINNIEREVVEPHPNTMTILQKTLENEGVEFLEGLGVRLKDEIFEVSVLEGAKGVETFYQDVLRTMTDNPEHKDILLNGVAEQDFFEDKEVWKAFRSYQVRISKKGVVTKLFYEEGDTEFKKYLYPKQPLVFRHLPKRYFQPVPLYVYGDKYAVFKWGKPVRIVVTHNKDLANSFRKQFNALWGIAKNEGTNP
jgi:transcriptional regulator with XRE-family HTH domain